MVHALYCVDCEEETIMSTSAASGGRNALKRVCTMCGATKKCLTRDRSLAATVAAKSHEEKVQFFRGQKRKQEQKMVARGTSLK